MQENLLNFDMEKMQNYFVEIGEKPFRAKQVLKWVHQAGQVDFDAMSNLAKPLREKLAKTAILQWPNVVKESEDTDGTIKWLLSADNSNAIETVFIPEPSRGTLCVSSQVGCALKCTFCSTGAQGFNRNLDTAEIIGQLWLANHLLTIRKEDECDRTSRDRVITNVVMMGMGEPLANYENVVSALKIMLDDDCYGLSRRKVTLSTSGIVPGIKRLRKECPVSLAVSLHAPNDRLRDELVPINKKYPIKKLLEACAEYVSGLEIDLADNAVSSEIKKSPRDFITFEYVMLSGINDGAQHARQLSSLLSGFPCKVNLIPFNSFEGSEYQRSEFAKIRSFREILYRSGLIVTVRKTRGHAIDGACGQLAGKVSARMRR